MTMQSYLDSGMRDGSLVNELRLQPAAQLFGHRLRLAGAVVVSHKNAVAVGHQPAVRLAAHLKLEADAGAPQLTRPDPCSDLLAVVRGRAVADVALGEDEAEASAARVVGGRDGGHVVDPRGLEEAQELDVVHVLKRVEVAEANSLNHREGVVRRGAVPLGLRHRRSGIWIRAIAFTSFQNRTPAGTRIATTMTMSSAFDALSASTATITMSSARIACMRS